MAKRKASKAKASRPAKRAKASGHGFTSAPLCREEAKRLFEKSRRRVERLRLEKAKTEASLQQHEVALSQARQTAMDTLPERVRWVLDDALHEEYPDADDDGRLGFLLGFIRAVLMYEDFARGDPNVTRLVDSVLAWQRSREEGGDKGRQTLTRRAEERARKIRAKWTEMEANGEQPTNESVARAVGCGRSTVIRAFKR